MTGRPAGWCDMIARFWPVDAVIGENGAFYFRYDHRRTAMTRRYFLSDDRARGGAGPGSTGSRRPSSPRCPGARVAADQPYRIADLAIDFREDCGPLPQQDVDRIVALFEAAGATAKVSSIHVNGWFGDWDKLAMTRILFGELYGIDLDAGSDEVAFIGDSPNDAPMFGYFPHASRSPISGLTWPRLPAMPAYVTEAEPASALSNSPRRCWRARCRGAQCQDERRLRPRRDRRRHQRRRHRARRRRAAGSR